MRASASGTGSYFLEDVSTNGSYVNDDDAAARQARPAPPAQRRPAPLRRLPHRRGARGGSGAADGRPRRADRRPVAASHQHQRLAHRRPRRPDGYRRRSSTRRPAGAGSTEPLRQRRLRDADGQVAGQSLPRAIEPRRMLDERARREVIARRSPSSRSRRTRPAQRRQRARALRRAERPARPSAVAPAWKPRSCRPTRRPA